jgi:HNH endonuclease
MDKPTHKKTCLRCGETFLGVGQSRFCGKLCGERHRRALTKPNPIVRECLRCQVGFETHNRKKTYCSIECQREHGKTIAYGDTDPVCQHCQQTFKPKREPKAKGKTQLYCSRKCVGKAKPKKHTARMVCKVCGNERLRIDALSPRFCSIECKAYRKPKPLPEPKPVKPIIIKECLWCGLSFEATNPTKMYCNDRCLHKNAKRVRKALKRKQYVEQVGIGYLMARDKGICQICRNPVEQNEIAPHPQSPSMDHIMPLCKGGKHSRANTQLAHFRCNSMKGSKIIHFSYITKSETA